MESTYNVLYVIPSVKVSLKWEILEVSASYGNSIGIS